MCTKPTRLSSLIIVESLEGSEIGEATPKGILSLSLCANVQ